MLFIVKTYFYFQSDRIFGVRYLDCAYILSTQYTDKQDRRPSSGYVYEYVHTRLGFRCSRLTSHFFLLWRALIST